VGFFYGCLLQADLSFDRKALYVCRSGLPRMLLLVFFLFVPLKKTRSHNIQKTAATIKPPSHGGYLQYLLIVEK
jgi:hypothetical protein